MTCRYKWTCHFLTRHQHKLSSCPFVNMVIRSYDFTTSKSLRKCVSFWVKHEPHKWQISCWNRLQHSVISWDISRQEASRFQFIDVSRYLKRTIFDFAREEVGEWDLFALFVCELSSSLSWALECSNCFFFVCVQNFFCDNCPSPEDRCVTIYGKKWKKEK